MPGLSAIPTNGHSVFAETQQFFTKQRAAIDKLKADNELLKEEVLLENKFSVRPTTTSAAATIDSLQEQSDVQTKKIGLERERVAGLHRQVAAMQDEISEQRRKMGGVNAAQECDVQAEKAMRMLENRVEQGYHRLNARRAATRALRDAIDGARKERLATAELQRKLGQQLSAARARAADLLRSAHAARLARDKARTLPVSP
ncbi:g4053 [Coccomyxa elongata]